MLNLRKLTPEDMETYFYWANDSLVRKHSFNSERISLKTHMIWFEEAINDETCFMRICQNSDGEDVGQVRIKKQKDKNGEALIGISIDPKHRGKGYAKELLILATDLFLKNNPGFSISAYIKEGNLSSKGAFENAGFRFLDLIDYKNFRSYHFVKK